MIRLPLTALSTPPLFVQLTPCEPQCTIQCTKPLQNTLKRVKDAHCKCCTRREFGLATEPPEPKVTGSSPVGDIFIFLPRRRVRCDADRQHSARDVAATLRLPIDDSDTEQRMRQIAIGRENSIFVAAAPPASVSPTSSANSEPKCVAIGLTAYSVATSAAARAGVDSPNEPLRRSMGAFTPPAARRAA